MDRNTHPAVASALTSIRSYLLSAKVSALESDPDIADDVASLARQLDQFASVARAIRDLADASRRLNYSTFGIQHDVTHVA